MKEYVLKSDNFCKNDVSNKMDEIIETLNSLSD